MPCRALVVPTPQPGGENGARRGRIATLSLAMRGLESLSPRAAARGLPLLGVAFVAGCSGAGATPAPSLPPSSSVSVTLSDAGCAPEPAAAPAGEVTFEIHNSDGDSVSEVDVQHADGGTIALQQNLVPGRSSSLVVWLDAGTYRVSCPGAATSAYTFTVAGTGAADWQTQPLLVAAVTQYVAYVRQQGSLLQQQVQTLLTAMQRGQLTRARSDYATARVTYEHLEQAIPDASLDRAMNGLAGNASSPAQFTGFHRVELALWQNDSTVDGLTAATGLATEADSLLQDLSGLSPAPGDITNNAVSSLTNAVSTRLTGEEESYSHLGLLMMQADLDAAEEAFQCVRPALQRSTPLVVSQLGAEYATAQAALDAVSSGGSFPPDTSLSPAQTRSIAGAFDTLAASMSKLAVLLQ
jgi:iron uptake system component EfeO